MSFEQYQDKIARRSGPASKQQLGASAMVLTVTAASLLGAQREQSADAKGIVAKVGLILRQCAIICSNRGIQLSSLVEVAQEVASKEDVNTDAADVVVRSVVVTNAVMHQLAKIEKLNNEDLQSMIIRVLSASCSVVHDYMSTMEEAAELDISNLNKSRRSK